MADIELGSACPQVGTSGELVQSFTFTLDPGESFRLSIVVFPMLGYAPRQMLWQWACPPDHLKTRWRALRKRMVRGWLPAPRDGQYAEASHPARLVRAEQRLRRRRLSDSSSFAGREGS